MSRELSPTRDRGVIVVDQAQPLAQQMIAFKKQTEWIVAEVRKRRFFLSRGEKRRLKATKSRRRARQRAARDGTPCADGARGATGAGY